MPNGTLDGFNHVLDFDEGLTHVFRVSAIVFLRQSFGDVSSVRNLSISCCDQLLNVLVILSHSGGLLLLNLFARQLGDIGRDPLLFKYSFAHPFLLKGVDRILCWRLSGRNGRRTHRRIIISREGARKFAPTFPRLIESQQRWKGLRGLSSFSCCA